MDVLGFSVYLAWKVTLVVPKLLQRGHIWCGEIVSGPQFDLTFFELFLVLTANEIYNEHFITMACLLFFHIENKHIYICFVI